MLMLDTVDFPIAFWGAMRAGVTPVPAALPERPKEYVQDRMRAEAPALAALLRKPSTHIYVCGLRGLEAGVEEALGAIGREHGIDWPSLRGQMREQGRYHVETY